MIKPFKNKESTAFYMRWTNGKIRWIKSGKICGQVDKIRQNFIKSKKRKIPKNKKYEKVRLSTKFINKVEFFLHISRE